LDLFNQVANAMRIDGITEFQLCFHFITFGNGHFAHIVSKAYESGTLPVGPPCCGSRPGTDLLLNSGFFPITGNYFSSETHAAHHETKFTVVMCTLVQVHEIHINSGPGDIAIELGMQVKEWFL